VSSTFIYVFLENYALNNYAQRVTWDKEEVVSLTRRMLFDVAYY